MPRRSVLVRVALWAVLVAGLAVMWLRFGATAATTLLTIVSGGAALAQIPMAWRPRKGKTGASTRDQLDQAADTLGWAVRTQCEADAAGWLLEDTRRLAVRWRTANGDIGDLDELVRSYAADPDRLVVIGEPGSGKTGLCMLLTLELVRRPTLHRIPVIVPISSWDPAENLHAWLIRDLLLRYPFLGNEIRYGTRIVRDLLAQDRILPLLDGLDEMAEEHRVAALHAISADARLAEPLVLTCRTDEFRTAAAAGALRGARVVELLPIEPDAAAGYLLDTTQDLGLDRWDAVLEHLITDGAQPLGKALRTPLMLFLARSAYARPDADPAELLRQPDARRIEEHLLDSFTRQVFDTRSPSPLTEAPRPDRRWDPDDAERWLANLARISGSEIAWWLLANAVPRAVFVGNGALLGGGSSALLGWFLFGLFGRPLSGVLLGLAVGIIGGAALGLAPLEPPLRFLPRFLRRREWVRDLGFGVIGALAGGLVVGVLFGAAYGVAIGLVFGLAFGLVRRFTQPSEPREAVTPVSVLHDDRVAVYYATGLGALLGTLVGAVLGLTVPAATHDLVFRIDNPLLVGLLGAGAGLLLGAGGLGPVTHATSASGRFITTRMWLALRGVTPLRLMSFLEDARRCGVLRQAGPYYEFRHALLHERLARRP